MNKRNIITEYHGKFHNLAGVSGVLFARSIILKLFASIRKQTQRIQRKLSATVSISTFCLNLPHELLLQRFKQFSQISRRMKIVASEPFP